jgi:hypothetical protein
VGEPANKFTYLTFRARSTSLTKMRIGRSKPSYYYLDENVVTVPFYLELPISLPYTETFKEKIDEMISNGLIKKFFDEWYLIDHDDEKSNVEKVERQVLTVYQLRLGFLAFLFSLSISLCFFFIELMVGLLKSKLLRKNQKLKPLLKLKVTSPTLKKKHARLKRDCQKVQKKSKHLKNKWKTSLVESLSVLDI